MSNSRAPRTIIVDNHGVGTPIVLPQRRFEVWDLERDLYSGPNGLGQYIPNVRDFVIDYARNLFWKVIDVDYTKFKYTLEEFNPAPAYNEDATIGGCAQSVAETFRVLVDPSKHPMTLRVDSRLRFGGADIDSIRIFRGTDITSSGEVISAYFKAGVLQGDTIPLVLSVIEGGENKTIKTPVPGHCKQKVDNGELVTIVVYSDTDEVAGIARAYILNTNMVLATETPMRQIRNVRLRCPFMSPSDDTLISLPIKLPLDDLILECEITYTDGIVTIPVDGNRAKFDGLRNSGSHDTFFISSTIGQKLVCQLAYRMGKDESYIGDDVVDNVIRKRYHAITEASDGAYCVKLFVVPEWLDEARGYRLRYFLYNLVRGNVYEATAHVKGSHNSMTFDPRLFGVKQRLVVNCAINEVNPIYLPHIHAQTYHITLLHPGNESDDGYYLEYHQGQEDYGKGIKALFDYDNVKYWSVDLRCGHADKRSWLDNVYMPSYPIYDTRSEDGPLEPTHFSVVIHGKEYLRTLDQWLEPFNIDFGVASGDAVIIKWIRRTPNAELQLGLSPMLAYQVAKFNVN